MDIIKMIAVDMDGTFLNNENDYNRKRFELIYNRLKKRKIQIDLNS